MGGVGQMGRSRYWRRAPPKDRRRTRCPVRDAGHVSSDTKKEERRAQHILFVPCQTWGAGGTRPAPVQLQTPCLPELIADIRFCTRPQFGARHGASTGLTPSAREPLTPDPRSIPPTSSSYSSSHLVSYHNPRRPSSCRTTPKRNSSLAPLDPSPNLAASNARQLRLPREPRVRE